MDLLFLEPVFKQMIWGGTRLHEVFGYETPGDDTGECWAISAHPNGDCVIKNGDYAGKSLSDLWENHRELFGDLEGDRFPLLVKLIDAKQDLSIQVHPNDEYAKRKEHGSYGKTECWYILDCDPDATIVIGHNAKDHNEVEDMIRNKRWKEFIREIPIKKGDFFQINPGCLHAIKGGTLLIETQQNSDITYRVYDYDRLSNGKPRELHVDKSIDVIEAQFVPYEVDTRVVKKDGMQILKLITCPYYSVTKYDVITEGVIDASSVFLNVSVIDGEGTADGKAVARGDHFIIPAGYGDCRVQGTLSLSVSTVS